MASPSSDDDDAAQSLLVHLHTRRKQSAIPSYKRLLLFLGALLVALIVCWQLALVFSVYNHALLLWQVIAISNPTDRSAAVLLQSLVCDEATFPLASALQRQPIERIINHTSQLGAPATLIVWEQPQIRCTAQPVPLMIPSFESTCALPRARYAWANVPFMFRKPGWQQMCSRREADGGRGVHEGAAIMVMSDGFSGPNAGYVYNASHVIAMSPWYDSRRGFDAVELTSSMSRECFEEVVIAHFVYDKKVGPHTVLEAAPMIAQLLDRTPAHIPILARLTPELLIMYQHLGMDVSRLVAFKKDTLYHAKRMHVMRRPEECSHEYWSSIISRLIKQGRAPPLTSVSDLASLYRHLGVSDERDQIISDYRPLIVVLRRQKKARRIKNFADLLQAIHVAFPPAAFDVQVFNGSLSLRQSITLFSKAIAVVGAHGGAFLNTLFMPPLSVVLEIAYPSFMPMPFPPYYYLMTCGMQLTHWITLAHNGSYDSTMYVDANTVVLHLQSALQQRAQDLESGQWKRSLASMQVETLI